MFILLQMAISTALNSATVSRRCFFSTSSPSYHCQINRNLKPALRLLSSVKEVRKAFVNRSSPACVLSLGAVRAQRPQATRAWILSSLLRTIAVFMQLFVLSIQSIQSGRKNTWECPTVGQRFFNKSEKKHENVSLIKHLNFINQV